MALSVFLSPFIPQCFISLFFWSRFSPITRIESNEKSAQRNRIVCERTTKQ